MAAVALPKSITSISLSGSLPEKLESAAAIGFDGIEIYESDLLSFDGAPADVRAIARELGLAITLFQPFRDFEAMPASSRQRNIDRAERKFDLMGELGAELLLVCSNTNRAALDDDALAAADLRELAERAARRGIRIGYKALAWGLHVRHWQHAWRLIQRADHPALGLIVDSFNVLSLGDDPSGLAAVPADRLFLVQLADAPKLAMDELSWSRHFRNFPGQGQFDIGGFLRAALASGYRGPLSVEVFNDEFRAAPSRVIARDALRSLIYAEDIGGGPALPAVPKLHGFEFVEFAVDAASGRELASLLLALGFHHAGTHRSKAVQLYRQGAINLVLNAEPDSAAAEHFHLHGPSVCALALRVDDAARTIRRADLLLCAGWQERHAPGEHDIPAIRTPDGTLIYLVDASERQGGMWENDFFLEPDAGYAADAGLLRIDHVAQALQPGRLDGFVLFYRSILGLEPEQLYELPDPYGLVRSRAMRNESGSVRMPLSISEGRETETGRFLSTFFGAGVHHVAFETRDAARTIEDLRARHAPLLDVPASYYDDLQARLSLNDATVGDLRRETLLYDRAENGGTFRHAYTVNFQGRFFFEICERRDGYGGYGAANAPVRMAAQARLRMGHTPEES